MKLKEVHRTATFAWSPSESIPTLASGTVSGALDASFSNDSQLEIWALDLLNKHEYDLGDDDHAGPKGVVTTSSRFNRLAWSQPTGSRSRGVIAAAMENGEIGLWDPEKICSDHDAADALILRNTTHQGSVRGIDFNPIGPNIFASGAMDGEIYVWDLKDPSKPYSPGPRSSKLDEITALAWNNQVQHVLASSSSTGYTVVWDLKSKREVVSLAYGGGAGTMAGMAMSGRGLGIGGRRGMSDVAWHPGNATRLVTSSEDDNSPVIMMWDLRNARAPEKILTGHEKGVLSLSWCKQDADLLLSCGKDNRALCWNPQTSEIIGELPTAENWAFQVQWCPRNPDLLATAYFDGTIGVHSLQSTNEPIDEVPPAPRPDGSDIFDIPRTTSAQATLSLKQPPKWLKRPVSCSFGYGGKLVSVSNLPSSSGKHQSSSLHLRSVVTEPMIIERAQQLEAAQENKTYDAFAQEKSQSENTGDVASWRALLSLYRADSREQLISLLGFSKSEIAARIADAVERLKLSEPLGQELETDAVDVKPHEPVVTFAEPAHEDVQDVSDDGRVPESEAEHDEVSGDPTPSEMSVEATSDTTDVTRALDGESATTAPSLFGDEIAIGTPHGDAGADFFSSMGTIRETRSDEVQVPHTNYPYDSSVAATAGSRPSSAASEVVKSNTFKIHPSEESEVDQLLTQALVLGDFEAAVSLCLSSNRFADAVLLAVKGGPALLQRTQKTYFERCTTALPYLRLFQSIVTDDLDDIVQNAVLQEWRDIFVVICTFAKPDEFASLTEQLGQRLEFQCNVARAADTPGAEEYRKNATLTYLAAGALEKVVNIWIEEMAEEEIRYIEDMGREGSSRYSAHAHALQSFIEKVTVFRDATKYEDADLTAPTSTPETSGVRSYRLAGLYDRYFEYADLLAAQGLVLQAVKYLNLAPQDYKGPRGSDVDFVVARERLLSAAGVSVSYKATGQSRTVVPPANVAPQTVVPAPTYNYPQYTAPSVPQGPPVSTAAPLPPSLSAYNAAPSIPTRNNPYAPVNTAIPAQPSYSTASMQSYATSTYNSTSAYQQAPSAVQMPAPPPPMSSATSSMQPGQAPLPPPPKRQENGGWNDAPAVADRRTPALSHLNKPVAITSPFANSAPSPGIGPSSPFLPGQGPSLPPPPPRPGSVQSRASPILQGPPRSPAGPQHTSQPPYAVPPGRALSPPQVPPKAPMQGRFAHGGQGSLAQLAHPGRVLSPGQGHGTPQALVRQQPPTQAVPQQRGPMMAPLPAGSAGPPGPYVRGTPPPGQPGSYAREMPPAGQVMARNIPGPPSQQPDPYGPSPGVTGRPGPPQHPGARLGGSVPPQNGPRGPPSVGSGTGAPPSSANASPIVKGPAPPKYPPGDRSHIPDSAKRSYSILNQELNRIKQITPPQQQRMVDDTERRLNVLFDAMNCDTLTPEVVAELGQLTDAMAARDQPRALAIHVDLLTKGSRTGDIGLWMSAIKLLIMRS